MKKIFSIILTLILSFFMVGKVSAQSNGSIKITGTTEEKTYEIYKIFDLTYSGEKVAYTIASEWNEFFAEDGLGKDYIVSTNSGDLNQITIGNQTKYINITEDNKKEFTEDALTYIATKNLTATDAKKTEKGTTSLEFTGLELGYYLVYPKGASDIKPGETTVCSLNSTVPSAEVRVKATYPTITKTANDESVDAGQLVEFTIKGKVPTTTGYTTNYIYKITDTWFGGLELPETEKDIDFKVTFGGTEIDVNPTYTYEAGKAIGFTLEFNMVDYQEEYKGEEIVVTYNLRATEDAIKVETKNVVNLTYSNNPKNYQNTEKTPDIEVKVYSSEIIIDKYDGNDTTKETKLAGAKFVLTKQIGGKTYYYSATDLNGNLITSTEAANIYTTTGLFLVEWTEDLTKATVLTTNEFGKAEFKGIENGNYELVEVEAPAGYNKLATPKVVTIEENNETKAISLDVEVENKTGKVLPSTGGIGTKLFIIFGAIAVLVSAIILVTNKRMSKEFM